MKPLSGRTTGVCTCAAPLCALIPFFVLLEAPPDYLRDYQQRCDKAKAGLIQAQDARIGRLEKLVALGRENPAMLAEARKERKKLLDAPPPLADLPLPPRKDDVGVFLPAKKDDARGGKSVDLLEVIDEDDAIVRVWYVPTPVRPKDTTAAEAVTFLDVWVHGPDLRVLAPGDAANLPGVFHVTGTRNLETDCGGRSFLYLVPIDIDSFRKEGGK